MSFVQYSILTKMLLAVTLALTFSRCGLHFGKPGANEIPPTRLTGYGLVNTWHRNDAEKLAGLLRSNGLNLTEIEYVAWFDEAGKVCKSSRTDIDAARTFVTIMRKHGIWTLISVVNWNCEAQRAQTDDWYRERLLEIRKHIGTRMVMLLPVSEPDLNNRQCMGWQNMAVRYWPGVLVANGPGGRGDALFEKAAYVDWHWCQDFTDSDVRPQPYINNTDCGPVTNPGAERTAAMARAAKSKNANFLIYDYSGETIDGDVIKALGQNSR